MKKITPWNPSRRATSRVKDFMSPPLECRHCGSEVRIVKNDVIYGRCYGEWPWLYMCLACEARVGMHPFTNIPLGTLANAEEREARKAVKQVFNRVWMNHDVNRKDAYKMLAEKLGIDQSQCHVGWFDVAMCDKAIEASAKILDELGEQ